MTESIPQDLLQMAQATSIGDVMSPLSPIGRAVERAEFLAAEIAHLGKVLKAKEAELREMLDVTIPDQLDQAGVASLQLANGVKVVLTQEIRASLAKAEHRAAAVAWLTATQNDALISTVVAVSFGKGECAAAERLWLTMKSDSAYRHAVTKEPSVNTTSFKAVVREMLKEGQPIPDNMGVYIQRTADIKKPRAT